MTDEKSPHTYGGRSSLMMNHDDTSLLIVDVQQKLLPLIRDRKILVFNIRRLIDGAKILGVRVDATEQYPKGLGGTVSDLSIRLTRTLHEKTMFSCRECSQLIEDLASDGITKVLLAGVETHVCVGQTALDFMAAGFDVYICVDAVGSRHEIDHQTAIRRLEYAGATPTTTEAVLFEWCEKSGSPEFKAISKLVQEEL